MKASAGLIPDVLMLQAEDRKDYSHQHEKQLTTSKVKTRYASLEKQQAQEYILCKN